MRKLDPDFTLPSRTVERVGHSRLAAGRLDDAVAVLDLATELNPRSITAWNGLALTRFRQHDTDGAAAVCRRVLEIDPNDWTARSLLRKLTK